MGSWLHSFAEAAVASKVVRRAVPVNSLMLCSPKVMVWRRLCLHHAAEPRNILDVVAPLAWRSQNAEVER